MKIIGIGTDLVKIIRIKNSIKKNDLFIDRIFTKTEKKKCIGNNKIYCLAKRFAAKEAFVKALGTGFRQNINFNSISINNDKLGKPYIKINNKFRTKIKNILKVKKFNIFLSISDDKNYAIANIIITT